MLMNKDLPAVAVHDVVVQNQAKELVVCTHGRSIYVASVKELQQLRDTILEKELHTFALAERRHSSRWGNSFAWWYKTDEPEMKIPFFTKNAGKVEFSIVSAKKKDTVLKKWTSDAVKGLNYEVYHFDLQEDKAEMVKKWLAENDKKDIELKEADNGKYYLPKGEYLVRIKRYGVEEEQKLMLK